MMYAFLADSDGVWRGEGDAADWLFIIATLVFLVAAALAVPRTTVRHDSALDRHPSFDPRGYAWAVAFVAAACTSFGLALL
jgi:hypothetical protein